MSGDETKAACKDAAQSLVMCMEKSSPCVQAGGKIMDCLKAKEIGDCEVSSAQLWVCQVRGQPSGAPRRGCLAPGS